jgi:single-stranded DNA-binding protein
MVKCIASGTIATDIELKEIGDDFYVAKFRLSSKNQRANKDDKNKLFFFSVSVFGKPAISLHSKMCKGCHVVVDGELICNTREIDGKNRDFIEITSSNMVEFVTWPDSLEDKPNQTQPQETQQQAQQPAPQAAQPVQQPTQQQTWSDQTTDPFGDE